MKSRQSRSRAGALSRRCRSMPPRTIGPTSWSRYSKLVTMPKLPPPPRSPQKRSSFSDSLACTSSPRCCHHVCRQEVVERPAELALEPAAPAPEREAADAGRRDAAAGRGEAERLCLAIELAPGGPALGPRGARGGIDAHGVHVAQVDHQAAVGRRIAGHAVATASHRDLEVVVAGEPDRRDHVRHAAAARDQRGTVVEHPVEDRPRGVVVRVGLHARLPH